MTVNKELMLNRRIVRSHRKMRRLAADIQTLGLIALLKKVNKIWNDTVDGVLYHKCW